MSIYLILVIALTLIIISAICSGLNIAIMSLSVEELRRKSKLGNHKAKTVLPLRRNVHLTLSAILLTNVAAVSAMSLVLGSVLIGFLAGIITTLLMVIFGEILPQAYFSRHALKYSARFAPAMRIMIFLTYPFSKPLQLLLDRLFSSSSTSTSHLHSRQELGIMITEHLGHQESELDEDEVEIIRGALQLSEKRVNEILLPIDKVFWLTPNTLLDPQKISEIKEIGRSRIPIFNTALTQCYGVLLMKDLVDIDFDEVEYRVIDLDLYPVPLVGSRTALDTLLRKFISTGAHLIPIERDDNIIGIVTIEDLIEEIVGQEIEDETDKRQADI